MLRWYHHGASASQWEEDMRSVLLGSAASVLAVGLAFAQAPTQPNNTAPRTPVPPAMSTGTATSPAQATMGGKAAASGDSNQAVATTSANADQPAKGSNSFTEGQARSRIAGKGFSHITGLKKDHDGIWRGKAQKDGQSTDVWLDYKGNVGQNS
jgi:hypothetical protein